MFTYSSYLCSMEYPYKELTLEYLKEVFAEIFKEKEERPCRPPLILTKAQLEIFDKCFKEEIERQNGTRT